MRLGLTLWSWADSGRSFPSANRAGVLINTFMLGVLIMGCAVRPEGDADVPREGLFHYALHAWGNIC